MSNMVGLNGFGFETTGKKLRLIEQIREFPDIPDRRSWKEICLTVMLNRLHFLSLFLKCRVQVLGTVELGSSLGVDFLVDKNIESSDLIEFDRAFDKMMTMKREPVEAYLNSCSAFHSALILEQSDYSIAFVLLAISVECLSNKYYGENHMMGFKRLFADYLPKDRLFLESELRPSKKGLSREESGGLVNKLLEETYGRIRSGFVHDGRQVPIGSILADRFGLAYIKEGRGPGSDTQPEKEDLRPSLSWFKRIVAETLLAFLVKQGSEAKNDLYLLVKEGFTIRPKAGEKGVRRGQMLTLDDLELQ